MKVGWMMWRPRLVHNRPSYYVRVRRDGMFYPTNYYLNCKIEGKGTKVEGRSEGVEVKL